MHCIMLGAGYRFQIMRILSLQAAYNCRAHLGGKIRVFSIRFLSASPTGIAEDIDVWSPVSQSAIPRTGLTRFPIFIKKRTSFRRGNIPHLLQGFCIKGSRHADGLRKDSNLLQRARHAVQCLVPPVIRRYAQTWNSRRMMLHQQYFLLQRQSCYKILHTHLQGQISIPEREIFHLRLRPKRPKA